MNGPRGVALDPNSGALFVVNPGVVNTVCRVPPGGGADNPRAHLRRRNGEIKREKWKLEKLGFEHVF
jgi:hypothetical protein